MYFDEVVSVVAAADELTRSPVDNCRPTGWAINAAVSEVLVGQPQAALATVAQLNEFDLPFMDESGVRALAHLARGDTATATIFIRRLATRAATGLFRGESQDAMVLFAALAHFHNDHDIAWRLVLAAGEGRQPGSIAYGRHLARRLGIIDDYTSRIDEQMSQPNDPSGATRSMNALRAELARHGWAWEGVSLIGLAWRLGCLLAEPVAVFEFGSQSLFGSLEVPQAAGDDVDPTSGEDDEWIALARGQMASRPPTQKHLQRPHRLADDFRAYI